MLPCSTCGRLLHSAASVCDGCGAPVPTRLDAPVSGVAPTALGPDPVPPVSGLLRPGQLFDGKYHIERQIGAGGMSVVYLATEVTLDTHVVIKALLPHLSHQPGVRERLLREAKALARIDHPNVVGLKSVVTVGAELFLVMEYVEGHDLAAGIEQWKTAGRPAPRELLSLFFAILDGVEAAHQSGIIHRDIKPSNVLLRGRDGRVKVTDFGIAKTASDGDHQLTSGMIGTLFYMAPEQLKADPTIDTRADLYALGVMLFEMLTGRVPFHAASSYEVARQHIQVPFPSLRDRAPELPLDADALAMLDVVLTRACAKEREHRYATCDELRQALLRCAPALETASTRTLASPGASTALPGAPHAARATPPSPYTPASPRSPSPPSPRSPSSPASPRSPSSPSSPSPLTVAAPSSRPVATRSGMLVLGGGFLVLGGAAAWWFVDPSALRAVPTRVPSLPSSSLPAPTPTRSAATPPRPSATPAPTASSPRCSTAEDCKSSTPRNASPLCHQGSCSYQCQAGLFDCEGHCFDLRNDAKHCGACGGPGSDCSRATLPPGASPRCEEGRCSFACPGGAERCEGKCCAPGEQCAEGKCVVL